MKALFDQLALIVTYGGIAMAVFVTLLLNNRTVRRTRANIFLSILLIALAFSVLHTLYAGRIMRHFNISTRTLGDPTFLLIAPALWFYVQELTGHQVKFNVKLLLHLAPFLLLILFFMLFNDAAPDQPVIFFLKEHRQGTAIFFWILVVVQFSLYLFFIHRRWREYQLLMEQEVSNTEHVSISWVTFFMNVFLLINLLFLVSLFLVIHIEHVVGLGKAIAVIFSLSIFALGYRGILQKEIFFTAVQATPTNAARVPEVNKSDQQLVDRLLAYMEEMKPYLDPELTLTGLAMQLSISRSQLSQLINEGVGDNFYNFINKYRVEQVKKYMNDPSKKNFNMLGIALEAGFKSKSTFNLIFKRFTGLTPSEYRKNLQ